MDSVYDIEFVDFENVSEDEMRKIRYMLKDNKSSGCVELPWKIKAEEYCYDSDSKSSVQTKELAVTKEEKVTIAEIVQFPTPMTQIASAPLHASATDNFVTIPTSMGYNNVPYFVTRTLPYLRAYPHYGVPFFGCPIPGTGEMQPPPYSQFVPYIPTTVTQKKTEQSHIRHNKKNAFSYSSEIFQVVPPAGHSKEMPHKHLTIDTPVSSTVEKECPKSVSLVPLPLPPATFAVASGTVPLQGYPPGLSTLSYSQMPSQQVSSASVYYVPIFNHPYGSYMPSPTSPAIVLPANLHQETEVIPVPPDACDNKLLRDFPQADNLQKRSAPDLCKSSTLNVQTELQSPEQSDKQKKPSNQTSPNSFFPSSPTNALYNSSACSSLNQCDAKQHNASQDDSNVISNECSPPNKQSIVGSCAVKISLPGNSNESLSTISIEKASTMMSNEYSSAQSLTSSISVVSTISTEKDISSVSDEDKKKANVDLSRRWADLFHIPSPETKGISGHHSVNQNESVSTENLTNRKILSVPTNDSSIEQ